MVSSLPEVVSFLSSWWSLSERIGHMVVEGETEL